ncbi:membrane protein [Sphaerisporangium melleum]|uniref:Membrane protein n=1 Tax=Sphaerisporangium melleum TaxID=321316 RepID=A0A917VCW0_9ACTN|nr:hypothetical protein [Sphaerisporangium melleum]GGK63660.1 membrane protein [Sphaerisporangium melleum]GII68116.1 membrane protein [Sphaerisporangium melleum]
MGRILVTFLVMLAALSGCGSEGVLSQPVIDQARAHGVAPDLIYVVDLPGYELAEQSVGGIGEEGFGAFYVSPDGRRVELRVDRGSFSDGLCVDTPIAGVEPLTVPERCDHDEVGWYRQGGGRHEYTAIRGDHYIRLAGGLEDVDRGALKAAVAGARPATGTGTPSPLPSPVERGDLPTSGDGAPQNEAGSGG